MRVISQNEKSDIPYEYFAFSIVGNGSGYSIIATRNIAEPPEVAINSVVATYSTEEKVIKAMEMLREEYSKYMEIEGHADLTGQGIIQPNIWVLPKVFQFPQDDEIEV